MKRREPPPTNEAVRHTMQGNTKKDTSIEIILRSALWRRGIRFRKNVKSILGTPDIVIKKYHLVVFCDGDFWHGHNWALRGLSSLEEELSNYSEFWKAKILGNIERDKANTQKLEEEGWVVLRLWESDIRKNLGACVSLVERQYNESMQIMLNN